jgi:hypothetical protein
MCNCVPNPETSFPHNEDYLVRYNDKICTWYCLFWRGFRTEFEVNGLGPQECYRFRLKAITAEGEGPWSQQLAATTKGNVYIYLQETIRVIEPHWIVSCDLVADLWTWLLAAWLSACCTVLCNSSDLMTNYKKDDEREIPHECPSTSRNALTLEYA